MTLADTIEPISWADAYVLFPDVMWIGLTDQVLGVDDSGALVCTSPIAAYRWDSRWQAWLSYGVSELYKVK